FNGGRAFVLLDRKVFRPLAVGGAAVADPVLVLGHSLEQGRSAGHGLGAGGEVLALEDVLLEKLVGARTILSAIDGDGRIGAAEGLPVSSLACENGLELRQAQFLQRVFSVDVNGQAIEANLVLCRA